MREVSMHATQNRYRTHSKAVSGSIFRSSALTLTALLFAGSAMAKDLTFGYVPASLEYPYNVMTAKGFEEAAKEKGVKTVVIDPRGSVEKQGNSLDDLLSQKVDAIGFLPLDSVVAEGFVDKVSDAKVPIVAIALQVGDSAKRQLKDPYPGLSALVATDNYQSGVVAGEMAAGVLPKDKTAKIGIVMGDPAYTIVKLDTDGFKAALDKAGAKYTIVAEQPTNWTPDEGEAVCQNFLTAHPDIDLIYSHADDMAIGCARAIDASASKPKLIATGGGSKLGHDAILAGEMYGSVCTRPQLLGKLMFDALYEAATKPETPKGRFVTYDMPPITKETIDSCPEQW
ncbi:sugar ABC transporter substrate-binding protein [Rhizobium leguminosarum]|uniref:Putative substrate-binding component of ABC transporter n=1 Tax=Rhizobium leguminosarum TaxID=384 RepID=A0A2K9Z6P9_RHILE|nr:sugar ABC transporter substrate-binding protein [Rhizobium leguminosarum]AUW43914.1 putative substrate-binding component of ABC transporter [Rhizobium leguminosarum]